MSLEFTLVRRAISLAVIDGPDAGDNPDILKAQGSVLFEPVIKKGDSIQVQTRGGSQTYALAPIECPINDGIISHRGQDGVKLPAGGEAANPSLIRWKATFSRMQAGGKSFTLAPVIFDAVPGGEIDLTMVAPVAGAPEGVVRGPRGTSLESIVVDGSELVFTAVDDAGSFEIARIPLDDMVRAEAEAAADGVRDALAVDVAASQSARDAAEGHAGRAATSESNAAASETNAKQSETNAGDYAAVATTAATEAVDAMERATDLAGGDFATHEYVDNGLGAKADRADLADGLNAIRQQEIQERDGTAWAHVTESGQRLPLGYTPDGSLDEHARTVWDREVNGVSVSRDDGSYAHVTIAKSGHVIHAVHEDGTVEIPGLLDNGRAGHTTTAARDDGIYTHVSTSGDGALIWGIRRDGAVEIPGLRAPTSGYEVYERDGEILPANVDTTQLASWGSSSMEFMQEQMRGQASRYGIAFHGHGKGAEDGYQTAARLGSRPALMTATGGVINASSTTELSSSNVNPAAAMLPYTATIAGIEGLVTPEATRFVFTRTTPGDEVAIEADTPAIPVAGYARRSDMTILNLGKNMVGKRAGAGAEIIELMDEAFAWLAPQKKRVLMIGHFANTGTPATGMYRDQINEVNNHLRSRYGRAFVDFEKFVTTSLVFDYLGTTPTQEDIAEQNLGNIPPGASNDGAHLHVAGRDAFARYLFDFMANLGWI